ncbi:MULTISPECIES: DUF2127 domain-containing protein [Arthrobacter]|uniref:DUF2127 domain-containing protein n=2 Tax=Arthrobacter TaxID=1663 RepID=A0ABU9KG65_9MICC|nr:DUF2127 domain-containing protein [Arthrobacter sp. YJM1]MDP5225878.1 DUF2127 domain-containing protein [Arthrobacter sp. YJM1]
MSHRMQPSRPEAGLLDRFFQIGVILKGLDGVLELVGGVAMLFIKPAQIIEWVRILTQHELAEDSHDLLANALVHAASSLNSSATLFAAVYLLAHGVVKVVLVLAVLRDKIWAYPWLIAFLVLFVIYQIAEMVRHFTWSMFGLTVFDLLIIALTVREYRVHRARRSAQRS